MQTARIPDFPETLDWLNSPALSLERELQGKIVVLDFWTFCCINCMHVLPDLAALEEKYAAAPIVFIGVHSPKFSNEQSTENIRQAVLRYGVHHPVVNDPELWMWRQLGISGWPTVVVLGPGGQLLRAFGGEGHKEALDAFLQEALEQFDSELDNTPIAKQPLQRPSSPLLFPGKIAVWDRVFIADSGSHRIIVTSLDGQVQHVIGTGDAGLIDGDFDHACFCRPQGLAFRDEKLYIADTENHVIRLADLRSGKVTTIAGSGVQGHDRQGGKKGREQALSSPWDLVFHRDQLFIAMAGTHQIWVHSLASGETSAYSGTGAEARYDGVEATWAQPSGLALHGNSLYVADSESSSVRKIDLVDGNVMTLAGGDMLHPQNLFAYGDRDGSGFYARLQHPLGVAYWKGAQKVIIADSYNHKLKLLDPSSGQLRSWVGDGERGLIDGGRAYARFWEPSGLALSRDESTLFVTDTNNCAIRKVEMGSGLVSTLQIRGL